VTVCHPPEYRRTLFGVNCTIKDGANIANGNYFGANSYISKNIDTDNTLYFGTPATPKGDAKKYM